MLGSLLIGGVAQAQVAPPPPTVKGISVFGRTFGPANQKVPSTHTIRFVNGDRVAHRIVSVVVGAPPAFNPIALPARSADNVPCVDSQTGVVSCPTATIGPFAPGRYYFVCTIHRRMGGSFEVFSSAAAPTPTPRPSATATPSVAPPPRRAVSILGRSVSPRVVRVPQGGELSWKNGSLEDHWLRAVVADGSASTPQWLRDLDTGEIGARVGFPADPARFNASRTFTIPADARPGKYSYVCLLHPGMAGQIIVDRVDPTQ